MKKLIFKKFTHNRVNETMTNMSTIIVVF